MKKIAMILVIFLAACNPTIIITPTQPLISEPTQIPIATTAPTPAPTPTERPLIFAPPNFVFQGDDPSIPIVTHKPSPQISHLYINPGAVVYDDGIFHMLFNSFTSWPGVVTVGYMQSENGYDWRMVQDEPVFSTDQIPFGNGFADVSSVVRTPEGGWIMYFHTVSSGASPMVIGVASAESLLGPWQVQPEPVLSPGDEDSWDAQAVMWPAVAAVNDGYRLYYGGQNRTGATAIGMATSNDGINWTKYDDSSTGDPPYAASDPVLAPSADWESIKTDRPRVQHTPDGWVMIYQASPYVEKRGLAISEDGIAWVVYPENPLFTGESYPLENAKTWDTALLYHNGAYYFIMELGDLSGTNLYLTVHQGSLRE